MEWYIFVIVIFLVYYLLLSFLGLYLMHKLLNKYPKQTPNPQVPQAWQGFVRNDYCKWDRKNMYLGAFFRFPWNVTLLFPCWVFVGIAISPFVNLLDRISGSFKLGIRIYRFFSVTYAKNFIMKLTTFSILDEPIPQVQTPIIISNHVGFFDTFYLISRYDPVSYLAKAEVKKIPIIGTVTSFHQSIYLERSHQGARKEAFDKISERVRIFNNKKSKYQVYPLVIFPEGTTSRDDSLLQFKIGAFNDKAKIRMVTLKYECENFQMGMDEINPAQYMILICSLKWKLRTKCRIMQSLQQQTPHQYMNRCREVMASQSGFKCFEAGFRQRKQYEMMFKDLRKKKVT